MQSPDTTERTGIAEHTERNCEIKDGLLTGDATTKEGEKYTFAKKGARAHRASRKATDDSGQIAKKNAPRRTWRIQNSTICASTHYCDTEKKKVDNNGAPDRRTR